MTLQLTARGAVADFSSAGALAGEFALRRCVRVPSLFPAPLLRQIHDALDAAAFTERAHGDIATELCMARNTCLGMLHFLVNDPVVFGFVERVTGVLALHSFSGRVYRRLPDAHHDSWHSDIHPDRALGMSVNLSRERYDGGVFEIRDDQTGVVQGSIANVGLGDAILFAIAPGLEHRVTSVTGSAPKTAFAGWFGGTRDYLELLRQNPFLPDEDL